MLILRILLIQANPSHFRIRKRGPGNDPIIRFEALEPTEQAIDGGIPGLMCGSMGELIRACHIAAGVERGHAGLKILVNLDGAGGVERDAQLLQTKTGGVGFTPYGQQQHIKFNRFFLAVVQGN